MAARRPHQGRRRRRAAHRHARGRVRGSRDLGDRPRLRPQHRGRAAQQRLRQSRGHHGAGRVQRRAAQRDRDRGLDREPRGRARDQRADRRCPRLRPHEEAERDHRRLRLRRRHVRHHDPEARRSGLRGPRHRWRHLPRWRRSRRAHRRQDGREVPRREPHRSAHERGRHDAAARGRRADEDRALAPLARRRRIDEIAYGPKGKPSTSTRDHARRVRSQVSDIIDARSRSARKRSPGRLGIDQINDVILVGGTTKIPYVRDQVTRFFAKLARADVNPRTRSRSCAALQANALERATGKRRARARFDPADEPTNEGPTSRPSSSARSSPPTTSSRRPPSHRRTSPGAPRMKRPTATFGTRSSSPTRPTRLAHGHEGGRRQDAATRARPPRRSPATKQITPRPRPRRSRPPRALPSSARRSR